MARYDIARFGSEVFRSSPRQADLFILAGTITRRMAPAIQMLWEQIPGPKYVIAMGACTDSNYVGQFEIPGKYAPIASYELLNKAVEEAKSREGVRYKVGNVYSHDVFYDPSGSAMQFAKMGVLAVEMEAAALYMNAAWAGKNALAICTISDHILTGEATTSAERQTAFNTMMEIALEIA
jgi:purine-nucleoside phosphorylase